MTCLGRYFFMWKSEEEHHMLVKSIMLDWLGMSLCCESVDWAINIKLCTCRKLCLSWCINGLIFHVLTKYSELFNQYI
jgi:hypothetical protein